MKTPLSWRNVTHAKVRSLIALCGISFAILLIFMQLGFHAAARSGATSIYDALDCDLLVTPRQYVFLARPGEFPRADLERIRGVDGVESAAPLWIALGEWRSIDSQERWNSVVIGIDPSMRPFRDPSLNDQLPLLRRADTVLSDLLSRPEQGPLHPGIVSEVEHHQVEIVGRYQIGAGFVAGATMITSRETFLRIFQGANPQDVSAGAIKLYAGQSPSLTARQITAMLTPSATAFTREDLFASEQRFWLNVKPIGIMFTSGVVVAFIAGAAILYQVLASEVQNRLREYATLKALGYGEPQVYGVVIRQALIFAALAFIYACLGAMVLYFLLRTQALVPVSMELGRATLVLSLTGLMCLFATWLALRKLRRADPADLF